MMLCPKNCCLLLAASPLAVQALAPHVNNNNNAMTETNSNVAMLTGAAAGLFLSAQVAMANPFVDHQQVDNNNNAIMAMAALPLTTTTSQNTMILAAGAYQPEDSFASLDMSMPSYGSVQNTAELLGGATSPKTAPVKKTGNPETDAKLQAAAQAKMAKARADAQAKAEKAALIEAKMAAKKAERTAMQQKRNQAMAAKE